ncbi:MAG: ribosome small subunit-dependent GTPase A [Gordonia sp. (in: high G+C Gram-positive bacteria)]
MSLTPDSPSYLTARLIRLGWSDQRTEQFSPYTSAGAAPARVARADRGRCDVLTGTGTAQVGDDRFDVVTGDWIAFRHNPFDPANSCHVMAVLPRHGVLTRASSDRSSAVQVLATNVDTVLVVATLTGKLRTSRSERLLALAWDAGATPIVVLTKADAVADAAAITREVTAQLPGVEVIAVSARTGAGIARLRERLSGTAVLLGPSGVGKSTLTNALVGAERMITGAVRAADGKGRHTTVTRELFPVPGGGVLIDTPGLRGIGLQDVDDGIEAVFTDVVALTEKCRFRDCAHDSEPDCAVTGAIEAGDLDAARLDRYRRMLRESRWAAARSNSRQARARKADRRTSAREQRANYRFRNRNER